VGERSLPWKLKCNKHAGLGLALCILDGIIVFFQMHYAAIIFKFNLFLFIVTPFVVYLMQENIYCISSLYRLELAEN